MCRKAPVSRENVIIVPTTITKPTSSHTGAVCSSNLPWSETESPSVLHGKLPERLHDRPEERREEEAVERERDGIAVPTLALCHQDVRRERERGRERGRDADRVEREPGPQSRRSRRDPTRQSASATQILRRMCSWYTSHANSAMKSGAVNWMSRAMPTGRRSIATKYSHCTNATPVTPKAARNASSRGLTRKRCRANSEQEGEEADRRARSSGSASGRADVSSEPSATFDTVPLSAKSVAAVATMR